MRQLLITLPHYISLLHTFPFNFEMGSLLLGPASTILPNMRSFRVTTLPCRAGNFPNAIDWNGDRKKWKYNWSGNEDRIILIPHGWFSIFKVSIIREMFPFLIHWRHGARGQNHLSDSVKSVLTILHCIWLLRMEMVSHFDLWLRLANISNVF